MNMGRELSEMPTPEVVATRILVLRSEKVLLDTDLAALYGVTTKRLNEQVRRNRKRFPRDFCFLLTDQELAALRSQNATSNVRSGLSVFVVRAFVRLRQAMATQTELAKKLEDLERKTESLALKHDALAADTRAQFREVIQALRRLMSPLEPQRRPIGFVIPR
jgi:hypothetical protein